MLLFTASGALLASDESAGLYLLLPVTVIAFISGVLNAWYFLLPPLRPAPSAHPHPKPADHPGPTGPTDPAGHARRTDHSDPAGDTDPASHTDGG